MRNTSTLSILNLRQDVLWWASKTHLWQSHIGNDDGVESARSVAQRLVLVTVGVVLVLEHLSVIVIALPGHGAFADPDVALRGHRRGFRAEIPVYISNGSQSRC